jgi:DNA-binding CsgD family transcriptional regulator
VKYNPNSTAKVLKWTITPPNGAADTPERSTRQHFDTPPPWQAGGETTVRHGYSLESIERIAKSAIYNNHWHMAGDTRARLDTAIYGVVELLYSSEAAPNVFDLTNAAWRACDDEVTADLRVRGHQRAERGGGLMKHHLVYWLDWNRHGTSPEGRIVEHSALRQILPLLTARQREAVHLLAMLEDYQAAAEAMGITVATFNVTIANARKRFLAYWHEGEAPSRTWGTDRRVQKRGMERKRTVTSRTRCIRRRDGRAS